MRLRKLAPVGECILVKEECISSNSLKSIFPGWSAEYYGSGTMALASALQFAFQGKRDEQRDVLLPAYACPELVSAILYANGVPVLVDLETDRPWLSLKDLGEKISSNTAAIIAVDLLGITERLGQIRELIGELNITLIEDSAQKMPRNLKSNSWQGDIVILSFGRGKPVSLLGGGALLRSKKNDALLSSRQVIERRRFSWVKLKRLKIKYYLYNSLITPSLYWIPSLLPFLKLGGTHFKELKSIESFDLARTCLLKSNLKHYNDNVNKNAYHFRDKLAARNSKNIIDLTIETNTDLSTLIRYPILIKNKELKAKLLSESDKHGLGISCLYKSYLPGVKGISNILVEDNALTNAIRFADELITLPIHSNVHYSDVTKIVNLID
jgi:dTDP-4-amino-4,6-dideoxygalactose transaminase